MTTTFFASSPVLSSPSASFHQFIKCPYHPHLHIPIYFRISLRTAILGFDLYVHLLIFSYHLFSLLIPVLSLIFFHNFCSYFFWSFPKFLLLLNLGAFPFLHYGTQFLYIKCSNLFTITNRLPCWVKVRQWAYLHHSQKYPLHKEIT